MAGTPHPLATLAQIINTPSRKDGIPKEVEDDLRVVGCSMIQEAGIMMNLPQSTIATAQVLLHRFFYVSSLYSFGVTDISISALFLATKLNETPIRLRELINTYIYLSARIRHLLSLPSALPLASLVGDSGADGSNAEAGPSRHTTLMSGNGTRKGKEREAVWEGMKFEVPGFHDEVFWEWKDAITAGEMQILKRLGFNMQVDLPYNHAINYLKILNLVFEPEIAQLVWSILNDMNLTPAPALHPPHTLACASILLATRLSQIALPDGWERLFDADSEDVWSVAGGVMVLWHDWGLGPIGISNSGPATDEEEREEREGGDEERRVRGREDRWRRAWVLCGSKRAVRRWVEETEKRRAGS